MALRDRLSTSETLMALVSTVALNDRRLIGSQYVIGAARPFLFHRGAIKCTYVAVVV